MIFFFKAQAISKGRGKSAIGASAYRSGESLQQEEGRAFDYTYKGGVKFSEISLPPQAPEEYKDRQKLWQSVEKVETQKNAMVAREVLVALPQEMTLAQQVDLCRKYIKRAFVDRGMCADWSIHDKGDGNPHCHILLTTRPIDSKGKWGAKERKAYKLDEAGNKIPQLDQNGQQKKDKQGRKLWEREYVESTGWNTKETLRAWKEEWAEEVNMALGEKVIDHRSYKEQGIDKEAQVHEGPKYKRQTEEQAKRQEARIEQNNRVRERNEIRTELDKRTAELDTATAGRDFRIEQRSRRKRGIRERVREFLTRLPAVRRLFEEERANQLERDTRERQESKRATERIRHVTKTERVRGKGTGISR